MNLFTRGVISFTIVFVSACQSLPPTAISAKENPPELSQELLTTNNEYILIQPKIISLNKKPLTDDGRFRLLVVIADDNGHSGGMFCPGTDAIPILTNKDFTPCDSGIYINSQYPKENLYVMIIAVNEKERNELIDIAANALGEGLSQGIEKAILKGSLAGGAKGFVVGLAISTIVGYASGNVAKWIQQREVLGSQTYVLRKNQGWNAGKTLKSSSQENGMEFSFSVELTSTINVIETIMDEEIKGNQFDNSSPGITLKKNIGDMASIPSGSFLMGSSDNQIQWHLDYCNEFAKCNIVDYKDMSPQHKVSLDSFQMDIHEITNSQYKECVEVGNCNPPSSNALIEYLDNDYYSNSKYANYPVVGITWIDATNYCKFNNKRLPTEAEWEYAAKGANNSLFPWSNYRNGFNAINSFDGNKPKANYCDTNCPLKQGNWQDKSFNDGYKTTSPVMSFGPGNNGIYDMAGNVQEWVADYYSENFYSSSKINNPLNNSNVENVLTRGGGWNNGLYHLTSVYRLSANPNDQKAYRGFRCARDN